MPEPVEQAIKPPRRADIRPSIDLAVPAELEMAMLRKTILTALIAGAFVASSAVQASGWRGNGHGWRGGDGHDWPSHGWRGGHYHPNGGCRRWWYGQWVWAC
jgi:hypothetical protein